MMHVTVKYITNNNYVTNGNEWMIMHIMSSSDIRTWFARSPGCRYLRHHLITTVRWAFATWRHRQVVGWTVRRVGRRHDSQRVQRVDATATATLSSRQGSWSSGIVLGRATVLGHGTCGSVSLCLRRVPGKYVRRHRRSAPRYGMRGRETPIGVTESRGSIHAPQWRRPLQRLRERVVTPEGRRIVVQRRSTHAVHVAVRVVFEIQHFRFLFVRRTMVGAKKISYELKKII